MKINPIGLGDSDYRIAVCIGNRPMLPEYQTLGQLMPLVPGEVGNIVERTGNHWRKIMNIYAKLMFQLDGGGEPSWQHYRDNRLLQQGCGHALLFSSPQPQLNSNAIVIVTGKAYAQSLGLLDSATAVDDGFYIASSHNLIVTPYFDYRQLSNRKLDMLTSLITTHFT